MKLYLRLSAVVLIYMICRADEILIHNLLTCIGTVLGIVILWEILGTKQVEDSPDTPAVDPDKIARDLSKITIEDLAFALNKQTESGNAPVDHSEDAPAGNLADSTMQVHQWWVSGERKLNELIIQITESDPHQTSCILTDPDRMQYLGLPNDPVFLRSLAAFLQEQGLLCEYDDDGCLSIMWGQLER